MRKNHDLICVRGRAPTSTRRRQDQLRRLYRLGQGGNGAPYLGKQQDVLQRPVVEPFRPDCDNRGRVRTPAGVRNERQ